MKGFFLKLGENPFYKKMMKEPLTYVVGAVLLAILNIAHFSLYNSAWGITSTLATWGAWLYQSIGGAPGNWDYFASESAQKILNGGFLQDGGSIRNLGIIFGALMATLFASQFKIKKIKSLRQIVAVVLGGLLMGYGARMANGCNIGAFFSATAALSLSGWIFAAFMLVGAFLGTKLLSKYFI